MVEQIMHIKDSLWHNSVYIAESVTAWILVVFGHVVGLSVDQPIVVDILPYIQLVSLLMACCASGYTIYKIRKDLNKNG